MKPTETRDGRQEMSRDAVLALNLAQASRLCGPHPWRGQLGVRADLFTSLSGMSVVARSRQAGRLRYFIR